MTAHSNPSSSRSPRQRLRLLLMAGVPAAALLAGGLLYLNGGRIVSTDDAYLQSARVAVSCDVPGRVVELDVRDNQMVKKGQVLFRLDPRPFRIAVEQARASLAAARLKVRAEQAVYRQHQADQAAARDTLAYAERELARQKRLLWLDVASHAQYDQALHAQQTARQQVAAATEGIAATLADLGGRPDGAVDEHPLVQEAQAALDKALLNLSYTTVTAPEDGMVTKVDQLQTGDYITTAQPLFALVSTAHPWIEANFKETELTHMRPGQSATVSIDTYPDRVFHAHVASLSPGTGSSFALLPAENATGNWVKVVQRLPVRLEIDNPPKHAFLSAGMSADVEVDTGHSRSLSGLISQAFAAPAEGEK